MFKTQIWAVFKTISNVARTGIKINSLETKHSRVLLDDTASICFTDS